jgi:hypothetical protein
MLAKNQITTAATKAMMIIVTGLMPERSGIRGMMR